MSILDILRKKKLAPTASSAEIEAALDKVLAELPAAREAYEAAELHRDDLVLDGTDKERDDAEREAARLDRVWRDLDVARAKLSERLDEAKKREAEGELVRLSENLAGKVKRQAEIVRQAAPLAEQFAALAREYEILHHAVSAGRQALSAAGRGDLRPAPIVAPDECQFEGQMIGNPFAGTVIPRVYPDKGKNPMSLTDMAAILNSRRG